MNQGSTRSPVSRPLPIPSVLAGLPASVAVAALTGLAAARRALGLARIANDPLTPADLTLDADRESVVMSTDGVPLAVREVGPVDAPITLMFVHGFTLRSASFALVRAALTHRLGDSVRMIFPDCRGHGDSGSCTPEQCTVALLGADIATVLDAAAPTSPVVLVGHSMGGMAICAFATRYPERIGTSVVGAALLGSASHSITDVGIGAALRNPVLDLFRLSVRFLPSVVGRGREVIKPLAVPLVTAGAYGPGEHSATMTEFSSEMSLAAPLDTTTAFFAALELYDERAALPILATIATSVVCGDHDWLTPLRKSKSMAAALDTELIVLADTGHMLILEAADRVAQAIDALVKRGISSGAHLG